MAEGESTMPKDVCNIVLPEAGTTEVINLKPGQVNTLAFASDQMVTTPKLLADGSIEISLINGSTVVIQNFEELAFSADSCGRDTIIQLSDNTIIYPEEMFAQLQGETVEVADTDVVDIEPAAGEELTALEEVEETIQEDIAEAAPDVANIEPAAGPDVAQALNNIEPAAAQAPGAEGRGYGFQSSVDDVNLNGVPAIGAIGETELVYTAPGPEEIVTLQDTTPPTSPPPPPVDDEPIATQAASAVDETNLYVVDGAINVDFGADGPGTFTAKGANTFQATGGGITTATLTSDGSPVTVTLTGNTYTGTSADGRDVFTLTINADGTYRFTLLDQVDHPDATDPNDSVFLNFGYVATDTDGDMGMNRIVIRVRDDGPVAVDDVAALGAADNTATGNVVTNDDVGFDDDGSFVSQVEFNGTVYNVPSNATAVIVGNFGTLEIAQNGGYTYTRTSDQTGTDSFTYTLVDGDGDTDTATLDVNVTGNDVQPIVTAASSNIDESGAHVVNGQITVDYGNDGPGTVTAKGANTFTVNGSPAIALTSDGSAITVTLSGNTYTGTSADGRDIFTLTINSDGSYTFTQIDQIDHPDATDPNDVVALGFGYVATDADGDMAMSTVTINVADDGPVAVDDTAALSNADNTATGNVVTNDDVGFDDDGSAVTAVSFNGTTVAVPATGTATIAGNFGSLTIAADGSYTYTRSSNAGGTDTFTYTLTDGDGDTDTADLDVAVAADGTPVVVNASNSVDETNYDGAPEVVTGLLNVNFFGDGPGTITAKGADSFAVTNNGGNALTSDGSPVTVTLNGNTYTGTSADGRPIFTLEINNNGSYTFTALDTLDHADPTDDNDFLDLSFGVTATDADGDMGMGTVTIRVFDDGPVAFDRFTVIDESSLDGVNSISVTDTLNFNFGEDGAGEVVPEGTFMAMDTPNGPNIPVTSQGELVTVTATANGYVGTDSTGDTVFTFTIDPLTGEYTFTQFQPIDHADGSNPNDVIWLKFAVNVIDNDGDTETVFVGIDVADDGPQANNDNAFLNDTDASASGNVIDNDDVGVDLDGSVTQISHNGTTINVPANGSTTIAGQFGTLTIAADGSYTYTRTSTQSGIDRFTYRLADGDGDTDTATLDITLDPGDVTPIVTQAASVIDESGAHVVNGQINVNYGNDGPGTVTAKGASSFSTTGNNGGNLTSDGSDVTVTLSGNTYTGRSADGRDVFTLHINSNGSYTFTQLDQLDHSNVNNDNESLFLNFGYVATDADGDMAMSNVRIEVRDDGPVAVDDTASLASNANTATGNVVANDDVGYDDDGSAVTEISFNGTTVAVPASGTVRIDGDFGYLRISANGSYTYTRTSDQTGTDSFTYELTDGDGDTDTATLDVSVAGNDVSPIVTQATSVIDETGSHVVNGQIVVDYGNDGPGTVTAKGANTFSTSGNNGGNLTSAGDDVTVTLSGNTYTGTASDGRDVFTLQINSDGSYTFRQLDQLDHSNPTADNESLFLNFGYVATDADGDMAMNNIRIQVRDDAPDAVDDTANLADGTNTASGNVMVNDDTGYDDEGAAVIQIQYNGTTVNVPASGTASIIGQYGTLVISANGNYTYTRDGNASGTDNFTYTLRDGDGDTDTAVLRVTTEGVDDTPVVVNEAFMLDETDYNGNDITVNGQIDANFFGEGPGTFSATGAGSFSATGATGGTLTSRGEVVVVALVAGKYVGSAGGREVFTLEINSDGSYTFVAKDTLDHSNPNNPNEIINLRFGVTATDIDGDNGNGTVTVQIKDDAPIAFDEPVVKVGEELRAEGNVLDNDLLSEDIDNLVTQVNFGGQSYNVSATGTTSIEGQYGTLTIDAQGNYEYILNSDLLSLEFNPTKDNFDSMPMSLTRDNITVTVKNPAYAGQEVGKLIWYDKGFGIWGNGDAYTSDRVNGGEILEFTFNNQPVTAVNLSLEHFANTGSGAALDVIIKTTGGNPLYIEYFLPDGLQLGDDIGIILNAADFGGGYIESIQIGSLYHLGESDWFEFTVKDVEAFLDISDVMDEFSYTVTDGDGDSDTAALTFMGENGHITITGQDCEETIHGTNGDDVIAGLSGSDVIYGNGGDDTIYGGLDNDTIYGGAGDDIIIGGGGTDKIYGGAGNDIINAGATLYEEPWNSDGGPNEIWGGSGADTFLFERQDPGVDIIHDFSVGEGDILDLGDFLHNYDPTTEAIENFVFQRQEGNNTVVSVDVTGSGNVGGAEDVVVLENYTAGDLEQILLQARANSNGTV